MHKQQNNKRITWLIYKALIGALTSQEHAEIEQWKAESKYRNILISRLLGYKNHASDYETFTKINEEEGWHKITSRINEQRKIKTRFIKQSLAIASVIVVTIGIFLTQFLFTTRVDSDNKLDTDYTGILVVSDNGKQLVVDNNHIHADSLVHMMQSNNCDTKKIESELYTLTTTVGKRVTVSLCDGTFVCLGCNSSITYPAQFTDSIRKIYLKGEAYFDVNKSYNKSFIVNTEYGSISVLGTCFNVEAYTDAAQVITTLVSGRVAFTNDSLNLMLSPGEQLVATSNSYSLSNVNCDEVISWINGKLRFENKSVKDIFHKLSKWYDIAVESIDTDVESIPFTFCIEESETIEDIINLFNVTKRVKIIKCNNKLQITSPNKN